MYYVCTNIETSIEQALDRHRTNIETSIEQALVPSLKHNINSLNENLEKEETQSKNDIVLKVSKNRVKVVEVNGEKIPQKPKTDKRNSRALVSPPDIVAVQNYFLELKSSEIEARKFYNYFQSNGWKVGGKAPMYDWQASARNWVLNAPAFAESRKVSKTNQPTPGQLNTTSSKNYSEPL